MTKFQIKLCDYLVMMMLLTIITIVALQIEGQLAGYAAMFGFGTTIYVVFRTIALLLEDHEEYVLNQDEQELEAMLQYEQRLQNNEGYYDRID